jgi:hypothetical protein
MMTEKFLAEFEGRALNGSRAYAIAREYPVIEARVWFDYLEYSSEVERTAVNG